MIERTAPPGFQPLQPAAVEQARRRDPAPPAAGGQDPASNGAAAQSGTSRSGRADGERPGQLSEQEQRQVDELKSADRKVRQHEMAHQAAGAGIVTRGAQYEYKRGPDGQLYAVGGEVQIDTSEVRDDPRATVDKMQRVQRAAMAPADPSPQDRRVAAEARAKEMQARMEMVRQPAAATGAAPDPAAADAARVGRAYGAAGTGADSPDRPAINRLA